jgi:uncharacterized protein (DUF488 family)
MMPSVDQPGLFSIGHSNISLEAFLRLLDVTCIQVVADVRTVPRSRYVPHFDAAPLAAALTRRKIMYLSLGEQLGGRPEGDEYYDADSHVRYDRLAESEPFQAGITRLRAGMQEYRIALLCSEEDPARCHRHLLIGRVLRSEGTELYHIRADDRLQPDGELVDVYQADPLQPALLMPNMRERAWRSLRSVSRGRVLPSSSVR